VAVGDRVRRLSVCSRRPKLRLQSCGSDCSVQYLTLPRGRPLLYFHLLRSWLPATSLHKHSPSLVLISDFRYPFRSLCFRIRVEIVIGSWLSLQLEKCVICRPVCCRVTSSRAVLTIEPRSLPWNLSDFQHFSKACSRHVCSSLRRRPVAVAD